MNYRDEQNKGKISPEKAQKMLKKEGMNVTVEQAEEILYFLRKLANMHMQHYLEKNTNKKKTND